MNSQEEVQEKDLLSLYDYLGKAAGSLLGKQVYEAASRDGVLVSTRNVETPYYTGPVLLYPREFLNNYFKK